MAFIKQIDCFNRNMRFWKFLGIWSKGTTFKYYDIYMKAFIIIFCVLYDALFTINFYFLPRQLDSYIEDMIFYFTELAVLSKVLTFYFMHDEIEEILNTLQSTTFQPQNDEEYLIIEKAKKFNRIYYNITLVVSVISHFTHVLSPLIVHIFFSVPLILPVCSYSFLSENFKDSFIYPLYFYQIFGMQFHMWYNVNIDTFFLGIMILTIAQLDILYKRFETVTDDDETETSSIGDTISVNDIASIGKLNDSIKHFDEVCRLCYQIQKVFSVTLFVQFAMASSIICVCIFRFTLPALFQYYIFLATYMFIMIIQILVPCWFGTRIIDKSSMLSRSLYNCDWITKSRRFKLNMRLLVERTTRPLTIVGWKMFLLSLKTFTSIINTAYSFFTLLRYMQSRQ